MTKLKWIFSNGGPYIGGAVDIVARWKGAHGLSVSSVHLFELDYSPLAVFGDTTTTDYEWACSQTHEAAFVLPAYPSDNGEFLVFAGDPNGLAVIRHHGHICFLNWLGADNENDILQGIAVCDLSRFKSTGAHISVRNCTDFVVIDSGEDYTSAGDEKISIGVQEGRYNVQHMLFEDERVAFGAWLLIKAV